MSADAREASSSADSSDSDFEEVDATPEEMELMTQLEADLETNPNLYDSHVQVPIDCNCNCKFCNVRTVRHSRSCSAAVRHSLEKMQTSRKIAHSPGGNAQALSAH